MDAIDTPLSAVLKRIAYAVELLERHGVGQVELERLIDDAEYRKRVAAAMLPEGTKTSSVDVNGEFNEVAMRRLVSYLFPRRLERESWVPAGEPWYTSKPGYLASALINTQHIRQLMGGLDDLHVTVQILRSGLLDGKALTEADTAERLGIAPATVRAIRRVTTKHMKKQQLLHFPFVEKHTWNEDPLLAFSVPDMSIEQYFGSTDFGGGEIKERVLAAGITTVGELANLPIRQLARIYLGDEAYLPEEHFPKV